MLRRAITVIKDRPQPLFIKRNDPIHARAAFDQPETIQRSFEVEEAPRPPRDSQFAGVGRDPEHAPTAIISYGGGLAISDWLSVAAWPFQLAKVPSAMVIRDIPNRGRMLPFRSRPNIESPQQTPLGDMYALKGGQQVPASLMKIVN